MQVLGSFTQALPPPTPIPIPHPAPTPCSHTGPEHSPGLFRKQLRPRERNQEPKPTQNQEYRREFTEGPIPTSCPVAVETDRGRLKGRMIRQELCLSLGLDRIFFGKLMSLALPAFGLVRGDTLHHLE